MHMHMCMHMTCKRHRQNSTCTEAQHRLSAALYAALAVIAVTAASLSAVTRTAATLSAAALSPTAIAAAAIAAAQPLALAPTAKAEDRLVPLKRRVFDDCDSLVPST